LCYVVLYCIHSIPATCSGHTGGITKDILQNFKNQNTNVRSDICALIKVLLPTDAQENCFKRSIKIYIKIAPTCFVVITIIRERTIRELAKVTMLKQSIKIHWHG